jgi:hypothetical protein
MNCCPLYISERFLDLPDSLDRSELYFYHTKFREAPSSFAWMAGKFSNIG